MSGTTTGIAPGFGGFAVTPDGEAQYMNRAHNPYAFLQQGVPTDTAPAANVASLASGGLAGVTPQQELQWQRFMHYRGPGYGFRRGGEVYRRFDDGGDTGTGSSDAAGAMGSAADNSANSAGNSENDAASGTAMAALGAADQADPNASGPQDPTMAQATLAAAKAGVPGMVASAVPGVGPALGVANALGLGKGISNALGLGAMSPAASFGSSVMGTVGGMMGGPLGAALGAGLGGYMGAHGNTSDGVGSGAGNVGGNMADATPPAQQAGQDMTSLIERLKSAMQPGQTSPQGLAGGGLASGPAMPNHNFLKGSGLIHGATDGRADALHMHVPAGGYVLPADVVSGMGQGNTMSGARKISGMLPRQPSGFASGGSVPVRLSAGEYFIHPEHVAAIGGGNHQAGAAKLDQLVNHVRSSAAQQVAGMPPPR